MKKLLFLLSVVLTSLVSLAQTPFVTTANLNMRTLPCTCAGVSATIPKGETIYVLNYEDDSWARVSYNGHVDYVSRKYIVQKANQPKTYKSSSSTAISSGNSIKYYYYCPLNFF